MFRVNFAGSFGAFGVPNEIVDTHLKLSGALSIKVLLILLRHSRPMGLKELAELLMLNEGDIKDALNYWLECGVVLQEGAALAAVQPPTQPQRTAPPVAPAPKESDLSAPTIKSERFRRMNRHDMTTLAQTDDTIAVIVDMAQSILARPLSSGESEMLVSLYHYYGMEADALLMLLTYCQSIGKTNAGYIEKLAIDWINREITSHERVEVELVRLTQQNEEEKELKSIFGIYDRSLTKKELEYYRTWKDDWGFNRNMVALAYEKTIDAKGKISFAYTNAILKAWNEKNIKTPDAAMQETKGSTPQTRQTATAAPSSYDLDKLDDMLNQGSVWD